MCTFPDITEPATISLTPSSPTVMAGDSVTLTCSISLPSGVTDTPVFQWEGPGVTPTPADPTSSGGVVSSILTLTSVSTSEAGLYSCTASLRGEISTNTIITVQSKVFLFTPNFSILAYSSAQFQLQIHSSPTLLSLLELVALSHVTIH